MRLSTARGGGDVGRPREASQPKVVDFEDVWDTLFACRAPRRQSAPPAPTRRRRRSGRRSPRLRAPSRRRCSQFCGRRTAVRRCAVQRSTSPALIATSRSAISTTTVASGAAREACTSSDDRVRVWAGTAAAARLTTPTRDADHHDGCTTISPPQWPSGCRSQRGSPQCVDGHRPLPDQRHLVVHRIQRRPDDVGHLGRRPNRLSRNITVGSRRARLRRLRGAQLTVGSRQPGQVLRHRPEWPGRRGPAAIASAQCDRRIRPPLDTRSSSATRNRGRADAPAAARTCARSIPPQRRAMTRCNPRSAAYGKNSTIGRQRIACRAGDKVVVIDDDIEVRSGPPGPTAQLGLAGVGWGHPRLQRLEQVGQQHTQCGGRHGVTAEMFGFDDTEQRAPKVDDQQLGLCGRLRPDDLPAQCPQRRGLPALVVAEDREDATCFSKSIATGRSSRSCKPSSIRAPNSGLDRRTMASRSTCTGSSGIGGATDSPDRQPRRWARRSPCAGPHGKGRGPDTSRGTCCAALRSISESAGSPSRNSMRVPI